MPESTYQRLTRDRTPRRFSVVGVGRVSLWLGSDHLLLVDRNNYTENYKRFYFRDIQAITVQKTSRRAIWNAVLAVPFAFCLFGFIVSMTPPRSESGIVGTIVLSIFLAILLVPILINNIRGAACACQLRTAVQTEDLGSLSRVRQTRKVLDKIRPLIVAAQGQLTPEEVSARMQAAAVAQAQTEARKPEAPPPAAPPSDAPPVLS